MDLTFSRLLPGIPYRAQRQRLYDYQRKHTPVRGTILKRNLPHLQRDLREQPPATRLPVYKPKCISP